MFNLFAYLVGKITAGIPIAVVITCAFYGAISGSGPVTTAAVGAMTIPILTNLGYKKDFSAALLILYVYVYCKRNGEDKEKVAANYEELKAKGFLNILKEIVWAIITPVIILGGIYSGIVTPTEVAVVSVFYFLQ